MKENTDINVDVVPDYASFLARNDIKGVYVNGTTGEGVYSLTINERLALAEAWVKEKAKVPTTIIQVGGCPLRDAQKLAAHAEEIGASAIAVLPSMFMFPSDIDELVEWIALIAAAAPNLPCLYYHIPVLTKVTRKFLLAIRAYLPRPLGKLPRPDLIPSSAPDFESCPRRPMSRRRLLLLGPRQWLPVPCGGCPRRPLPPRRLLFFSAPGSGSPSPVEVAPAGL